MNIRRCSSHEDDAFEPIQYRKQKFKMHTHILSPPIRDWREMGVLWCFELSLKNFPGNSQHAWEGVRVVYGKSLTFRRQWLEKIKRRGLHNLPFNENVFILSQKWARIRSPHPIRMPGTHIPFATNRTLAMRNKRA